MTTGTRPYVVSGLSLKYAMREVDKEVITKGRIVSKSPSRRKKFESFVMRIVDDDAVASCDVRRDLLDGNGWGNQYEEWVGQSSWEYLNGAKIGAEVILRGMVQNKKSEPLHSELRVSAAYPLNIPSDFRVMPPVNRFRLFHERVMDTLSGGTSADVPVTVKSLFQLYKLHRKELSPSYKNHRAPKSAMERMTAAALSGMGIKFLYEPLLYAIRNDTADGGQNSEIRESKYYSPDFLTNLVIGNRVLLIEPHGSMFFDPATVRKFSRFKEQHKNEYYFMIVTNPKTQNFLQDQLNGTGITPEQLADKFVHIVYSGHNGEDYPGRETEIRGGIEVIKRELEALMKESVPLPVPPPPPPQPPARLIRF